MIDFWMELRKLVMSASALMRCPHGLKSLEETLSVQRDGIYKISEIPVR